MKKNAYKKETDTTSAKITKKTRFNPLKRITPFFSKISSNKKVSQVVGVTLFVISAFLLLAFSSFLLTWKVDQNIINNHWNNPNIKVENWLGKLGAYTSHQFIFKGFGISSFLVIFLSFILGFRVLFKTSLLPLKTSFNYAIFAILWLSISLSYLLPSIPILGGSFGFQINFWLNSIVGGVGILLVLILSALTFSIINFNLSFDFLLPKKKKEEEQEGEHHEASPKLTGERDGHGERQNCATNTQNTHTRK